MFADTIGRLDEIHLAVFILSNTSKPRHINTETPK